MKPLKPSIIICISIFWILSAPARAGSGKQAPVVELEETLRIKDTGIDFYFRYPRPPVIDQVGALYVLDKKQLLKFDTAGKFIGNYYADGLGPGESNNPRNVFIQGDHFVLYNAHPHKFLWFDRKDGTLKDEIRLSNELRNSNFVTQYGKKYYFFQESMPRHTNNKAVFVDIKVKLLSYGLEDKVFKEEGLFFLKKYFISKSKTRSSVKNVNFEQVCPVDDHTILVANNGNYEVQCFDLKEKKIIPFIKKAYKKVLVADEWKEFFYPFRFEQDGLKGIEYKTWTKPDLDDIQKIFRFGSKVWVVTSTFDDKTRLVNTDVFDLKGKYINTFLLNVPEKILIYRLNLARMRLHNHRLFIFEKNEDGDYELARYNPKNVPSWAK